MKPESTTLIVSAIELVSKRDTEEADGSGEVLRRRPETGTPRGRAGRDRKGISAVVTTDTPRSPVTWT
jgi:hypothetical protein